MMSQSPKRSKLTSQSMHGSRVERINVPSSKTLSLRHSNSFKSTPSTLKRLSDPSSMSQIAPNSQTQNGRTSSLEGQSILTPSSVDNSPQLTMTPRSKSSEISRSLLERLNPPNWSKTGEIGPSPGIGLSEPLYSCSLTVYRNSPSMESTLSTYSPLLTPASTAESSRSIKPSGRELGASGILNCQTSRSMPISKSRTWI